MAVVCIHKIGDSYYLRMARIEDGYVIQGYGGTAKIAAKYYMGGSSECLDLGRLLHLGLMSPSLVEVNDADDLLRYVDGAPKVTLHNNGIEFGVPLVKLNSDGESLWLMGEKPKN